MPNLSMDSCFHIGLFDPRDQHYERSRELFTELFEEARNVAVVFWPVLYESISTQLVGHKGRTQAMEREWRRLWERGQLLYVDDSQYREAALEECLLETRRRDQSYRALSLTDRVLRAALLDINLRLDGIISFNEGDFADVCKRSGRQLVN